MPGYCDCNRDRDARACFNEADFIYRTGGNYGDITVRSGVMSGNKVIW